jgi:hypothetical protein
MWILWNPVAIILRVYASLQMKPRLIRKECQLRINPIFNDRLYKPTAKMNPASWISRLQDMRGLLLCGLSFSNFVALLALGFDTPVALTKLFSDFLGVCSSLAPTSSNFSSVNTRHLCSCFLYINSPVVLSLFTKLWSVCWELFHHEIYVDIFADTF